MSSWLDTILGALSDSNVPDLPASGVKQPPKPDLRAGMVDLDATVSAITSGLLNNRGALVPALAIGASGFPTTGGSGSAGAIKKYDTWFIQSDGYLVSASVNAGDMIWAATDAPAQTLANWHIITSSAAGAAIAAFANRLDVVESDLADKVDQSALTGLQDNIDAKLAIDDAASNGDMDAGASTSKWIAPAPLEYRLAKLVLDVAEASDSGLTALHEAVTGEISDAIAPLAEKTTILSAGGLIQGGGTLADDPTFTLPKAVSADIEAGLDDEGVPTPKQLASVFTYLPFGFNGWLFSITARLNGVRKRAFGVHKSGRVQIGPFANVAATLKAMLANIAQLMDYLPLQGFDGTNWLLSVTGKLNGVRKRVFGIRTSGAVWVYSTLNAMGAVIMPKGVRLSAGSSDDAFDRAYLDGRSRRKRVVIWGDSTSQEYLSTNTTWAQVASARPYLIIDNRGVASQKTYNIIARQGSGAATFIVPDSGSGHLIPSSGPITLTPTLGADTYGLLHGGTNYDQEFMGELMGVPGKLFVPGNDSLGTGAQTTFTRTLAGPPVCCPDTAIPFVIDRTGLTREAVTIISMGRNNVDMTSVMAHMTAVVASLGHTRFLIESILTTTAEVSGSAGYIAVTAINAAIKTMWPDNYCDTRAALVAAYDPAQPADVTAYTGDTIPPSLCGDGVLHINTAGSAVKFTLINSILTAKGWLS